MVELHLPLLLLPLETRCDMKDEGCLGFPPGRDARQARIVGGRRELPPRSTTMTTMAEDNKENQEGAIKGYQVPWVEKYRPRTLDDVVGNEETVHRLRAIAETGNLPNLILAGPPGTGKTTSVHALARQLLGPAYKEAVLELNASDARGIDVSLLVAKVEAHCCSSLTLA